MFIKQAAYTGRWHIYTAPFTPLIVAGKMASFETKADAEKALAKLDA